MVIGLKPIVLPKTTDTYHTKIVLIDDHVLVRDGLAMLIGTQPDMSIAGLADSATRALRLLESGIEADLVIIDLNLPVMNGFDLLTEIKQRNLQLKTMILSMQGSERDVQQAIKLGASGYLLKSIETDELLFAIRHIIKGNTYICSASAVKLLQNYNAINAKTGYPQKEIELSDREDEILQLIAQGFTNIEMANKLFLSKRTIEGHRQSLLDKTNSKNTATLIRFAATSGLLY